MWESDEPLTCAQCDESIRDLEARVCVVCSQLFCGRHVFIRDSVATCAACQEARRQRENNGPISQADVDRVVGLLTRDLLNTTGSAHESVVTGAASHVRTFTDNPADFEQRVVDDVQQYLHDTFIDTSWPACPEHPHHPLWYSDGYWKCDHSGRLVAALGGLRPAAG